MQISIFGQGDMGKAIAHNFETADNEVRFIGRECDAQLGDIVVLAVPFTAVDDVVARYGEALKDKIVIDITNPVDFSTFDDLVIPAGTSAAEEIQKKISGAAVVKAFNTNFAGTLASGKVGSDTDKAATVTTFVASDSDDAKTRWRRFLKEAH